MSYCPTPTHFSVRQPVRESIPILDSCSSLCWRCRDCKTAIWKSLVRGWCCHRIFMCHDVIGCCNCNFCRLLLGTSLLLRHGPTIQSRGTKIVPILLPLSQALGPMKLIALLLPLLLLSPTSAH